MESNNLNNPPPPAYQQNQKPGQTYYQPPENTNYPPPPNPPPPPPANNMGQRFTQFYAPPQNKRLGMKRRLCSFLCCCIIIGLIIGLSAGLTRRSYYNTPCNCRTNADCLYRYGAGTYCYSNCQCARR
ncbi:uncharacterized protein B0P05DRAFT_522607 [Gilbertella persicaria]|uniref:uncharacterized protein n=1 Tax=Gilbertella persicaria TaxID=101096 RepID=UPI00222021AD|nr:uncharacterized protein B0P05DRAFT_522607 [Gilbertella persicaria]KAI8097919.1 hypothetical protein B0P05DRAFT_522607 [Gilbertella persicaria]